MAVKLHSCENARTFFQILRQSPTAAALVRGGSAYPAVEGRVALYQTRVGVLVSAEFSGLPSGDLPCGEWVFALHIHSGASCTGDREDPFQNTLGHYNPGGCAHPGHAGDLLPLFGSGGYAFSVFLTDRFCVEEVLGRTVVLHRNPDDFTTQPSGNAGEKIACGRIEKSDLHGSLCTTCLLKR